MIFYEEDLAYVHQVGFAGLVEGAAPELLAIFGEAGLESGTVVDLGCGSGLWARRLVDAGFDVVALDVAPAMVELTRASVPEAQVHLESLWSFELPTCVAVTVLGEGLNYATGDAPNDASLEALFRRVAQSLAPGGVFAFDAIVGSKASSMSYRDWRQGKDWAVLVDVVEDPDQASLMREIVVFREHGGVWRRSDERHAVRVLDAQRVCELLAASGFEVATGTAYGSFELASRRQTFVARRKIVS